MKFKDYIKETAKTPWDSVYRSAQTFLDSYKRNNWPMMSSSMQHIDKELEKMRKAKGLTPEDVKKINSIIGSDRKLTNEKTMKISNWIIKRYKTLNEARRIVDPHKHAPWKLTEKIVKDISNRGWEIDDKWIEELVIDFLTGEVFFTPGMKPAVYYQARYDMPKKDAEQL